MSVWFGDLQWYLFGSHATGEADEHSDIDIMVEGIDPEDLEKQYWQDMSRQAESAGFDVWLHHKGVLYPVTQRNREPGKDELAVRYAMHHRRFLGVNTLCLLELKRSIPDQRECTNQDEFIARGVSKHLRLALRLAEFGRHAESQTYNEQHVASDKLFVVHRSPSGMFRAVTFNTLMRCENMKKLAEFEKQAVWFDRIKGGMLNPGTTFDAARSKLTVPPNSVVSWADENSPLREIQAGWPKIVCAAMRTEEGLIIPSPRHCDRTFHALTNKMGLKKPVQGDQGFIDQYGAFYTRAAAWFLHVELSDLPYKPRGGPKGDLYSEHLY